MHTNSPYREIPKELIVGYTMNNQIHIRDYYFDNSKSDGIQWSEDYINSYIQRFTPSNIYSNQEGESSYGHYPVSLLLQAFEKYDIRHKKVAVVGSESPWIEAILINMNNNVTTIEYNVPTTNYTRLETKDYFIFATETNNYDCIVTFSSIEHSGLGRYGDPLDPDGDIKTMKTIHDNLRPDGLLIWGSPVGPDALFWNAHRVYGNIRLPLLFQDFKELEWLGWTKEDLMRMGHQGTQPVVILRR